MNSTRRLLIALLLVVVTVPAFADFSSLARAIDSRSGVKRIWIPFLGLARIAVRVVEPEGVRDFQLATFEGTENLRPEELQAIMRNKVGKGFTPLVQVWSKKSREWSFIYARPHGRNVELIVLAHEDEETVLVRIDVDADMVARTINDHPRRVTSMAGR